MAGVLLASTDGAGWTVETVDLALTGRAHPLGDGPQLLVRRYGRTIAYVADVADLAALGVDVEQMDVVARWLIAEAEGFEPSRLLTAARFSGPVCAQARQLPRRVHGSNVRSARAPTTG